MVKAGNPLRGVFVVAPSGTAQLNHFIGSFPERGYAANPPSVCLSRPLVFQNVPTQVFKGDVRLSAESRRTHAPSPPSVYPRVAVDATPPTRLSGESRNLRHPPPQPPRRSGRQPNQSQQSLKSNESQFKTKRPPPTTTPPPPLVFPAKAGIYVTPHRNPLEGPDGNQTSPKNHPNQTNHSSRPSAPHPPPHHHPTRLSGETRNPHPLSTFRIPTSRRRRHAPHPSFRRKPESTSRPTATPSKVRAATKPVPTITQIKRITVQDQAPPTATPSKVRAATKPIPKITQIKRITVQDQAPPTSHHTTTPPVFPAKPGTRAPSAPSVYPRVAVDATPPNRLSGESRNLRHPPTATPSKVRAATKPVPKITQIKRITVQDQAPPTSHHTTTPPVFPPKAGTRAPSPPSVYPRVAVDATPPTRLSGESRNLRHSPTATPSKVRTATKPVPKITQIKRITVQDQAPPTSHHTTTPTRLSAESRNPRPLPTFRIPTSRRRRHAPHPSFRRKPESTSPPTATPSKVRTATKPVPKITQIKRITVQDQAPPTSHHTTTPTRLSAESWNPRPLPTFRIPTSRRSRHAPHPSFRRKPESTSPPTATPSKVRTATKPVPKITQIKRITVQDQAPPTSHHTTTPTRLSSETRNPRPLRTFRIPTSRRRRHAPQPSFR